jgi:uncharacterized membrane protein
MMELIKRILYNLIEVHPLHPLIVHFPIALISAGLFFILLALWRHNDELEKVAFANIALATVSTLAAGITGWLDNVHTYDGAAPNVIAKIILASVLLGVTLLITVARWRKPDLFHSPLRIFYISGYFVSFGLVAVLGFLGGVILYGFQEIPVIANTGSVSQSVQLATPQPLPTVTTATVVPGISFAHDILPILKSRCTNCHGGQKTERGLNLTSYETLMAGSENGPVIIPKDSTNSPLAEALIERKMPKRGPKLSPEQAQLIIDWIEAGAPDN